MCRAVTKHHYLVTRTEDLPRVFKEAFHIATTGRPGPVIVDVPKDVQTAQIIVPDWDPPMNLPGYRPYRRATRPELEKVLEMIRAEQASRSSTPAAASSAATRRRTSKRSPNAPAFRWP